MTTIFLWSGAIGLFICATVLFFLAFKTAEKSGVLAYPVLAIAFLCLALSLISVFNIVTHKQFNVQTLMKSD